MLVFPSDVHLTDGSSGTTIEPRAWGLKSPFPMKLYYQCLTPKPTDP